MQMWYLFLATLCLGTACNSHKKNTDNPLNTDSLVAEGFSLDRSGVLYKIIDRTDTTSLVVGDFIEARTTLYLINGTRLTSDIAGNPFRKMVVGEGSAVPGLDLGFTFLHRADSALIAIPPALGYGNKPYGNVAPNTPLMYGVKVRSAYRKSDPVVFDVSAIKPIQLKPGLQMFVVEEGKGDLLIPNPKQMLRIHYTASLLDGTIIDNSYERGHPFQFALNGGIYVPAWNEAIKNMRLGGKARFIASAPWAYGKLGVPPKIPGNATVVFDIHFVEAIYE